MTTQRAFGDLFVFIRNGMNVSQDKSGRGLPVTRIETIWNATIDESRVGYADLQESDCVRWLLQPGDILFSHINSVEHIGKCAVYRGSPAKLVHGVNLLCLRCDQSRLLPEFAKYLIRGPAFRSQLARFVKKAVNQASVSIGDLMTIAVTLPPLPEQARIAEVLDRADALRAKRRAVLAQVDTLGQSIFVEMFGRPTGEGSLWARRALSTLAAIHTGGTPPSGSPGMFDGAIPFVTPGDLESGRKPKRHVTEAGALMSALVPAGATLVCCIGATIGKMGKTDQPSSFNQQINAVVWSDEVDEDYGYAALRLLKPTIRAWASSTTLPILKKSLFERIEIPVPPRNLQAEFSRKVAALHALLPDLVASSAFLDQLFESIEGSAFGGGVWR